MNKRKKDSQWWDDSWNPVTGCTAVSEGCAHCYAKAIHNRFYQSGKFEKIVLHPERISKIDNTKPKVIFVNSMSDLFHEKVPFEFITEVFSVMQRNPLHVFVLLTKRAKRMEEYFTWVKETYSEWRLFYPLENVWLGVTVENNDHRNRLNALMNTPAKHRFVSVEPMLEAVDLGDYLCRDWINKKLTLGVYLDLVICGGESGPGARLMRPEWARVLRDQCVESNTPFFFKQWGEWVPDMIDESVMVRSRSTGIGRKLDGVEWNELPWIKNEESMAPTEVQLPLEVK